MRKNAASQSGIFNPRVLLAFTLCSVGALLAMFSLAATPPVETTHANTSVPPDSRNFLSTFGSNANHLPRGVPLPPGTQFSLNGQGDPLKQQPTAVSGISRNAVPTGNGKWRQLAGQSKVLQPTTRSAKRAATRCV